jgi:hypothetical protein
MLLVVSQILNDDLTCLQDFYAQTVGSKWTINTNWDTTVPCSFFGIVCTDT